MKNKFSIIIISLCIILPVLCACSAPQPVMPASFTVQTLKVTPQEVLSGAEVSITAEVANTGGMPGNFDEPLLMDGKQAATKLITIQPGSSKTLTYTVKQGKTGKHTVELGGVNASFTVRGMVEKDIELKYDNDKSEDALWAGVGGGFLICFDPPTKPFGLKRVRICGGVYGVSWEGKTFDLYVLDSDMKSMTYSQTYAMAKFPVRGAFPYQPPVWVDFDVPVTNFNNKFYVYLSTNTFKHRGVHVGVDNSVENDEHSFLAQGKPPFITIVGPTTQYPATIWYADITKINWMIRAVGTSLVPE
jgi:hypothetical protein